MKRFMLALAILSDALLSLGGGRVLAQGDSWKRIEPDMPTARRLLAAASVGDNLYAFGGCGSPCFGPPFHTSTDEETSVEVYLPREKRWEKRKRMPTILFGAAAAAVKEKIYTFGGYVSGNVVQEYDPSTDSWKLKAPMPTPRFGLAAVELGGKIYVLGGSDGERPSAALEIFDPKENTWITGRPMPTARVFLAAAEVGGKIYAIGGSPDADGKSVTAAVEIYDPGMNEWRSGARLPIARQVSAAVGVNGKIYVFGGFIPGEGVQADTFEYDPDPQVNRWVFKTPMPIARDQAPAVLIGSKAIVVGGSIDCHCKALNKSDEYDPTPPKPPVQVNVSIEKTDHQETVCPGDDLIYEITVSNKGPDPVAGATVVDDFPEALDDVSWSCTATPGSSCTSSGSTALHDTIHLLKDGKAIYSVEATVAEGAEGKITNSVQVDLPQGVVHLGTLDDLKDDDVDKILTGGGVFGVALTRPEPEPLKPGASATYTATVTPVSGTFKDVEMVTVITGAVFGSPLPAGCHAESETRVLCELGDLSKPSDPLVFPIEVLECQDPAVVYSATVSASTPECDDSDNFAEIKPEVEPASADLKLSIDAAPEADEITYELTVKNLGPDQACDVHVHQLVTAGKLTGSTGSCGPLGGSEVDCPFTPGAKLETGPLEPGATLSFETTFAPCAPEVHSEGMVSSATRDPNNTNNQDEVETGCGNVDLVVTKTDLPDPVGIGDELSYTIKVENTGTLDAAKVIVKDLPPPPEQLSHLLWCVGKDCVPNKPGPVAAEVDIAAGAAREFQMRGTVNPIFGALAKKFPVCGPLLNRATAEHPEDKAEAEAVTQVQGTFLSCPFIDGPVFEGAIITKTFVLINCGPAAQMDDLGPEFTDALPASLTLIGVSADSGTPSMVGNTAFWNGSLGVGETVEIKVQAMINPGTAGTTICNEATSSFAGDAEACCIYVPLIGEIPTLSELAAVALALLLAAVALRRLRLPSAGG